MNLCLFKLLWVSSYSWPSSHPRGTIYTYHIFFPPHLSGQPSEAAKESVKNRERFIGIGIRIKFPILASFSQREGHYPTWSRLKKECEVRKSVTMDNSFRMFNDEGQQRNHYLQGLCGVQRQFLFRGWRWFGWERSKYSRIFLIRKEENMQMCAHHKPGSITRGRQKSKQV